MTVQQAASPAAEAGRGKDEAGLGPVVTLTVLHTINDFYGLVLPPLLPLLQQMFALSYLQAGAIQFITAAVPSFSQALIGYWADLHRRRVAVLVAGFLLFAAAMLLLAMVRSYAMVLLAALALGIAASAYHPQSTTLLSTLYAGRRGWASGIHGIGNGLGFIAAPLTIGYLAGHLELRQIALVLAVPAVAGALIAAVCLREPALRGRPGLLAGITRPLLLLTLVNGIALAASTGFVTFLPAFYVAQGVSVGASNLRTALMTGAAIVAQPLGGTLSDRLGRRTVLALALLGSAICIGLFAVLGQLGRPSLVPVLLVLSVGAGFCLSLTPPVGMAFATDLALGARSGTAVGLVWGMGMALASLAPPAAGAVIDRWGFAPAQLGLALIALAGAALALRLPGQQK